MKNGMKKVIASTVLAGLLMLSSTSFAAYDPIYRQESAISKYADGVTHQNIRTFTNEGWINLNVMRIDLTKNVSLTAITDQYLTNRDTLTNIVKKNDVNSTIVAAINTDFFGATSLGNIVNKGNLISTSVGIDEFASFNVSTSGMPFIAYINSPNNTITNGTSTFTLDYINKPYVTENRLILFDHNWAKQSYGGAIEADIVEMYVKDGYIHEIRTNGAPFELSENAYVIAAVGTRRAEITQKLRVGDAITVNYDVNFRFMDLSVGGGAQLVSAGKVVTQFSQNINGKHPRTGLGITQDRKEVILVTVDGRTNSYRGVTQTELAEILISLGAFEGINFDGGGSTQMVAKSPWTTQLSTLNFPSEQSERRIFTALGVEKILVESPVLNEIQIELKQDRVFLGTPMPVSITAIDTNYTALNVDQSAVKWSVSGIEGVFENGKLYPKSAGKGKITAEYNGKTATKDIVVSKDAIRLMVSPAQVKMAGNQTQIVKFSVQTQTGDVIQIEPWLVSAKIPEAIGTYDSASGTLTTGAGVSQGILEFSFDGLTTYVPAGVGTTKVLLHDFETPTATFSSFPLLMSGNYQEIADGGKTGSGGLLSYDFSNHDVTRAAYMNITTPKQLQAGTQAIGLWAFGDYGNAHWLRGRITDANGTSVNLTFAKNVNWTGWKYLTAEVPNNLVAPFALDRIYLAEVDPLLKDSGYIIIDDVEAVVSHNLSINVPANITRVKGITEFRLPDAIRNISNRQVRVNYLPSDSKVKVETKYSKQFIGGIHYLTMVNKDGSIRQSNVAQWKNLIAFTKENPMSPIVISMSDSYQFKDRLEGDLLFELLGNLVDRGTDVTVVFPSSAQSATLIYRNGVKVIQLPRGVGTMAFGIAQNKLHYEWMK
jgi:hypothetical protein